MILKPTSPRMSSIAAGLFAHMSLATTLAAPIALTATSAVASSVVAAETDVFHRKINIDGINIAYREAGNPKNPAIILLHGFPTSSQMFRELIPQLADDFYVLAPDYPGYGASDMPTKDEFDYSFANIAIVMNKFLEHKDVSSYSLYLMDYGAPIGYRIFYQHPERVQGFVIQNGNAYEEGLSEFWDPIKAYWNDQSTENAKPLRAFLELEATKWQYTHGVSDIDKISPDTWHQDQFLLDREGNKDIQMQMFLDYRTNVGEYPKWQASFREHQPPALIVWGKNDHIFPEDGAHPYKQDLKNVEFHLYETGHFALEEFGDEIAIEIKDFLNREVRN